MLTEREAAEVKYQELSKKHTDALEDALKVERDLRSSYQRMDMEWKQSVHFAISS